MLYSTRKNLNILIDNIKHYANKCDSLVSDDSDYYYKDWELLYIKAVDDFDKAVDDFEYEINTLWNRNLCKTTQKRINYYLRKAGFKPRKITAQF
jgi:hypothetical protein